VLPARPFHLKLCGISSRTALAFDLSTDDPKRPMNDWSNRSRLRRKIGCTAMAGLKRNGEGLPSPRRPKFDSASSSPQSHAFIKSMARIVAGVLPLLAVISIVPTLHVHM